MLEFMIAAFCTQATLEGPKYTEACNQGLRATSIQLSIDEPIQQFERKIQRRIEDKTGRDVWIIAGVYYHLVQTNELRYMFPAKPISDTISLTGNPKEKSIIMSLTWSL